MAKPVLSGVSSDAVALVDAFAVGEFYVRASRMEPREIPIAIGAGAIGLSAVAALESRRVEPIIGSLLCGETTPERFDVFREREPHIGIGQGAHVCIGMHLARLDSTLAFDTLFDRLPGLRLNPDSPAPYIAGMFFSVAAPP